MPTYRLDLHVHTDASPDGRSSLSAQVAAAKRAGLDAIAVTDHNCCTPVPPEQDGILLIPGCEVSTRVGHITGLFLRAPLDLTALAAEGLPSGQAAVAEIRRCGGLAVLAHPFQKPDAQPQWYDFAPDGVETANARAAFHDPLAHSRAAEFALHRHLTAIGGSDGHSAEEVGNAYTLVDAPALTCDALRSAVAAGQCCPVLERNTSHRCKGMSQLTKARRMGGPLRLVKGLVYLCYTAALDVLHPFPKIKG